MPFEQIPYTNFHGTNQDWMIQQIKQMIADWASYRENLDAAWAAYQENLTGEWTDYQENINNWRQALDAAFTELHTYVHDYFDNLDVQEEINNKLDQMAEDGTLDDLLMPYFNTYTEQINNTVATQNNKIATLESRIDNFLENTGTLGTEKDPELIDIRVGAGGNTYPSAGDAVRAQLSRTNEHLSNVLNLENINLLASVQWEIGSFDTNGQPNTGYTTRLRTADYVDISIFSKMNVAIDSGYKYKLYWYQSDNTFISDESWSVVNTTWNFPTLATKFKVLVADTNDSDVTLDYSSRVNITSDYPAKNTIDVLEDKADNFNVNIDLTSDDFFVGTWSSKHHATASNRLSNNFLIQVKKGDVISYRSDTLLFYMGIHEGLAFTQTEILPFTPAVTEKSIIVPFDGDLAIILKKDDNSNLVITDYDANISIVHYSTPTTPEVNHIIDYLNNGFMLLTKDDFMVGQWYSKSHSENTKRLCTKKVIPVKQGDRIIYETGTLLIYFSEFLGDNVTQTMIKNYGTVETETTFIIPYDGDLAITLKKSDESDITLSDFDAKIKVINDFASRKDSENYSYKYYGEKIQLQGFNATKIITVSTSYGAPNDFVVYGNYLLSGANNGYINIYNLTTGELINSVHIPESQHYNTMVFSNTKYNESDLFPLLYAETEGYNGLYLVIRLADTSAYEIIKQYRFPETIYGTNPQVYWNFEHSIAYAICIPVTGRAPKYNFFKFDLTNETANQDGTYTPEVLYQSEIENPGIRQGGQYYNNRIYLMSCTIELTNPQILVINCNSIYPEVVTNMPNLPFTNESEGLSIAEDNNGNPTMYISNVSGDIYRLKF